MANLGLKERYDFQQWIIKDLKEKNGYIQRDVAQYNPRLAMDVELLWDFLMETQEETIDYLLKKLSKETIINLINTEIVKGGFLFALKEGVFIENKQLRLLYRKPATSFNEKAVQQYQANRLSVIEEVVYIASTLLSLSMDWPFLPLSLSSIQMANQFRMLSSNSRVAIPRLDSFVLSREFWLPLL